MRPFSPSCASFFLSFSPRCPAAAGQVKKLLGPYLVFMASTVNGYEGTGRSLSLKLLSDLRKRQGQAAHDAAAAAGDAVAGSKTKKVRRRPRRGVGEGARERLTEAARAESKRVHLKKKWKTRGFDVIICLYLPGTVRAAAERRQQRDERYTCTTV